MKFFCESHAVLKSYIPLYITTITNNSSEYQKVSLTNDIMHPYSPVNQH